mgnify:CR=1 FL=1
MNHPDERSIEGGLPEAVITTPTGGVIGRWWMLGAGLGAAISLFLLLQGAGPTVTLRRSPRPRQRASSPGFRSVRNARS